MKKLIKITTIALFISCFTNYATIVAESKANTTENRPAREKNLTKKIKDIALAGTIGIGFGLIECTFNAAAHAYIYEDSQTSFDDARRTKISGRDVGYVIFSFISSLYVGAVRNIYVEECVGNSPLLTDTGSYLQWTTRLVTPGVMKAATKALADYQLFERTMRGQ